MTEYGNSLRKFVSAIYEKYDLDFYTDIGVMHGMAGNEFSRILEIANSIKNWGDINEWRNQFPDDVELMKQFSNAIMKERNFANRALSCLAKYANDEFGNEYVQLFPDMEWPLNEPFLLKEDKILEKGRKGDHNALALIAAYEYQLAVRELSIYPDSDDKKILDHLIKAKEAFPFTNIDEAIAGARNLFSKQASKQAMDKKPKISIKLAFIIVWLSASISMAHRIITTVKDPDEFMCLIGGLMWPLIELGAMLDVIGFSIGTPVSETDMGFWGGSGIGLGVGWLIVLLIVIYKGAKKV
jgi:hypothetical protein